MSGTVSASIAISAGASRLRRSAKSTPTPIHRAVAVYRDGRWLDTREPTLDARLLVVEVNLLGQMRVDAACPGKTEGLLVADDPIPLHGRQCRVPSNG